MNDEEQFLKQWTALKEDGLGKAKSASNKLLFIGIALTAIIAIFIFFQVNSIFIALASAVVGWSIAERNALRSRVNLWPKLEKYLSWEEINERLSR